MVTDNNYDFERKSEAEIDLKVNLNQTIIAINKSYLINFNFVYIMLFLPFPVYNIHQQ